MSNLHKKLQKYLVIITTERRGDEFKTPKRNDKKNCESLEITKLICPYFDGNRFLFLAITRWAGKCSKPLKYGFCNNSFLKDEPLTS
jgi:hypothetical protein